MCKWAKENSSFYGVIYSLSIFNDKILSRKEMITMYKRIISKYSNDKLAELLGIGHSENIIFEDYSIEGFSIETQKETLEIYNMVFFPEKYNPKNLSIPEVKTYIFDKYHPYIESEHSKKMKAMATAGNSDSSSSIEKKQRNIINDIKSLF